MWAASETPPSAPHSRNTRCSTWNRSAAANARHSESRPAGVFESGTFTFEDDRFSYGEQRFVTLGMFAGIPVSIVHTEHEHEIRVISFRKATKRESQIYFNEIQN